MKTTYCPFANKKNSDAPPLLECVCLCVCVCANGWMCLNCLRTWGSVYKSKSICHERHKVPETPQPSVCRSRLLPSIHTCNTWAEEGDGLRRPFYHHHQSPQPPPTPTPTPKLSVLCVSVITPRRHRKLIRWGGADKS